MTRSTPSASCSEIWASDSSGTSRSPRRSCASRRWAFSMARSPPLTATYMLSLPSRKPRRARYGDNGIVMNQHDIDAARKQRGVDGQPLEQISRLQSWRAAPPCRRCRGRAARKPAPRVRLSTCRISVVERSGYSLLPNAKRSSAGRFCAIADQREAADRRIRDNRRAGVELEPFGDVRRRRHPRIEPDRRIVIEQGQRDRGGAAHHRCRRAGRRRRCAERCRDAPSHPSRSGRSIAPTTPCRQILRAVRQRSSSSALTPHQRVEIDPRRRRFRGLAVSLGDHRRAQRRDHLGFDRAGEFGPTAPWRRTARSACAFSPVAAERVAKADLAGRQAAPRRATPWPRRD